MKLTITIYSYIYKNEGLFLVLFMISRNTCVFCLSYNKGVACVISVKCGRGNGLCYLEEMGNCCLAVEEILVVYAAHVDDGRLWLQISCPGCSNDSLEVKIVAGVQLVMTQMDCWIAVVCLVRVEGTRGCLLQVMSKTKILFLTLA